jgi:hypothetical protein
MSEAEGTNHGEARPCRRQPPIPPKDASELMKLFGEKRKFHTKYAEPRTKLQFQVATFKHTWRKTTSKSSR